MKIAKRVAACAVSVLSAACAPVITGPSYSIDVRLHDGRSLWCNVNQPEAESRGGGSMLTIAEQNEADVLATQPLRLMAGPWSPYPSPYTAPHIRCFDRENQKR